MTLTPYLRTCYLSGPGLSLMFFIEFLFTSPPPLPSSDYLDMHIQLKKVYEQEIACLPYFTLQSTHIWFRTVGFNFQDGRINTPYSSIAFLYDISRCRLVQRHEFGSLSYLWCLSSFTIAKCTPRYLKQVLQRAIRKWGILQAIIAIRLAWEANWPELATSLAWKDNDGENWHIRRVHGSTFKTSCEWWWWDRFPFAKRVKLRR